MRTYTPKVVLLLLAALAAVAPWVVFAATINAKSGGFPCDSNWSNASAWDLGRAPISGDDVVFGVNPSNPPDHTNYDLITPTTTLRPVSNCTP